MSHRQCVFGVSTKEMPGKKLFGWVRNCMADQARQGLRIPETYLLLDDEARARRAGLQLFMIGVCEPGDRVLTRYPLFEYLFSTAGGASVLTLLHDDGSGVFRFERYGRDSKPPVVTLLSDGPYLGATKAKLTVDYPQKGFTHADLRLLHELPPERLSEREARAIMNYANAVTIGLRQFHPGWSGSYLDMLARDTAWRVFDPKRLNAAPEEVPRPKGWRNFVAPWPEEDEWALTELQPRDA